MVCYGIFWSGQFHWGREFISLFGKKIAENFISLPGGTTCFPSMQIQ